MEEKPQERRYLLIEKAFGVVAICWDETQVKRPEVPFHQILYFVFPVASSADLRVLETQGE